MKAADNTTADLAALPIMPATARRAATLRSLTAGRAPARVMRQSHAPAHRMRALAHPALRLLMPALRTQRLPVAAVVVVVHIAAARHMVAATSANHQVL